MNVEKLKLTVLFALFVSTSLLLLVIVFGATLCKAETMVVERVVPAGSALSYSEGGQVVRTLNVPPGRVRVTIEYNGSITLRHKRGRH